LESTRIQLSTCNADLQSQCTSLNITCPTNLATCLTEKQIISQQRDECIGQKNSVSTDTNTCLQLYSTCVNDKNACLTEKTSCATQLATCQARLTAAANNTACTVNIINQINTAPTSAFCGNYFFSQTQALNLNSTSCTGCKNTTKTCSLCTDKNNSILTGKDCFGCAVGTNATTGACFACIECSQVSYTTTCKRTNSLLASINLDGKSCTGCSTVNNVTNCSSCSDKAKNGNSGTTCSECNITSGSMGICKVCDFCSTNSVTIICSLG
jgi:hypothetical protein